MNTETTTNVESNLEPKLRRLIAQLEQQCSGRMYFAAQNLTTGQTWRHGADTQCKTASVIKLPILVHVALAVQEGELDWNEPLPLTEAEKVAGSGVLTHLGAGLATTLRDACVLMTIVSDNTATNMVIERVGVESVNARMRTLGLPVTTCFRKAYSPDTPASAKYGLGVTTPNEMLHLLTLLANNELGSSELCTDLRAILKEQQYRDAIPRYLPDSYEYAGKTGAINAVRNDVGIVTASNGDCFVLALFCQDLPMVLWTADNPGLVALARLAKTLLGVQ